MTENDWAFCDDVSQMIEYLWEQEPYSSVAGMFQRHSSVNNWQDHLSLELPLYRFYLASCRNIWMLLPQEESRKGVELAEQFVAGGIDWERVIEYNHYTEGAAFCIDYDIEPDKIASWVKEIESMSAETLGKIINSRKMLIESKPRELLLDAAYFADYAMLYPSLTPKGPPGRHTQFMFPDLLREFVDYPLVQ